jgi:hypothetical protein
MRRYAGFFLAVLCLPAALPAARDPGAFALPKGARLTLPRAQGVDAAWILPGHHKFPKAALFDVSPAGDPWLGYGGKTLMNPLVFGAVLVDRPAADFAWTDSNEFLVSDGQSLGFLVGVREKGSRDRAVRAVFKPMVALPHKNARLFAGGYKEVYFLGKNPDTQEYEIHWVRVRYKKAQVRKLFSSKEPITSVAAGSGAVYAAMGRAIVELNLKSRSARPVFVHPRENIRDIGVSPRSGLFYSTGQSIGFFKNGSGFEFLQAPRLRMRLRKNSLYVLFEDTGGVLRVDGLHQFKNAGAGG